MEVGSFDVEISIKENYLKEKSEFFESFEIISVYFYKFKN
jgi:hypothetical protein